MPPQHQNRLTIQQAQNLLTTRQISSQELTQSCLDQIAATENSIRSFITLTPELALTQAKAADQILAQGPAHPLTGIPLQIKDVISTHDVRTTCASRMLADYIPPYNATAAHRLLQQGAVMLGKGNMDEFAMGSSCENSAFHPTRNPWDTARVPGGSSGGAAASVAAGQAIYALGSDTGGSVRQPAALCGVTGLKPSYGLVSRYGLIAYASSLDQIGPIAQTAADCALILTAIAGHDPQDATSLPHQPPDYAQPLTPDADPDLSGIQLGIPAEYFAPGTDPQVRQAVEQAIKTLQDLGASPRQVSLPSTKYALACYYIIAPSECSANLARYDGVKYGYSHQDAPDIWTAMEQTRRRGFGPEVTRRIMLGAFALSAGYYDAYYRKAQQARTLIRQDFAQVFQTVDALITPTSPVPAFPLGEKTADPLQMYLLDVTTLPVNVAGLPALSLPCGFTPPTPTAPPLPIGMQLIGPHLSEPTLLQIAHAYQQTTQWHTQRPPLLPPEPQT